MALYRKKPVVVSAFQWLGELDLTVQVDTPDWIIRASADGAVMVHVGPPRIMTIKTLEGVMTAQPRDWIIQGIQGEIYPCKPDIFAQTYEKADELGAAE